MQAPSSHAVSAHGEGGSYADAYVEPALCSPSRLCILMLLEPNVPRSPALAVRRDCDGDGGIGPRSCCR